MSASEPFNAAYADRRVLVTGHTGFKGPWLCSWLERLGAQVFGLALEPDTVPSLFNDLALSSLMDHEIGDVRDSDVVRRIVARVRPEVVVHMAAQPLVRRSYAEPHYTFETNVMGTANVLEAARASDSVHTVLIVTTDKVYENPETGHAFSESEPLGGADPYSASKACAEIVTGAYRRSYFGAADAALVATARAGNVIGGGDWAQDRLLPDCARACMAGEAVIVRNPASVRPWQHVLESLSGYLTLGAALLEGRTDAATAVNFGPQPGDALSVAEMVERFVRAWGSGSWESPDMGSQPHEAGLLRLDISKARQLLSWEPVWGADRAVTATAAWYRAYAENPDSAARLVDAEIAAYTEDARAAGVVWASPASSQGETPGPASA